MLYNSDVLMYDRQTESLWSQLAMQAVSGPSVGRKLELISSEHMEWEKWMAENPTGRVLSRDTGSSRNYGRMPYQDYERTDRLMFPVRKYWFAWQAFYPETALWRAPGSR